MAREPNGSGVLAVALHQLREGEDVGGQEKEKSDGLGISQIKDFLGLGFGSWSLD